MLYYVCHRFVMFIKVICSLDALMIVLIFLTLGACARGTVVSLCVCVCMCVFVCYPANCYIHHFKVRGEVS